MHPRCDLRRRARPQTGVAILWEMVWRRVECRERPYALRTRRMRARIPDAGRRHGDVLHGLGVLRAQRRAGRTVRRSVIPNSMALAAYRCLRTRPQLAAR